MTQLTEKEALVMKVIWDLGEPIKSSYLLEVLNKTYDLGWKASTLATYLKRLEIKGFVTKNKHLYSDFITREMYLTNLAINIIDVWGSESARTLIDALICTLN